MREVEAEVRRWQAEWRLARKEPATLEVDRGDRLRAVAPDSPAARAGLRAGDRLRTVNCLTVASFAVVGVMAVIAIGLLEPANIAVLFELRKPQPNPAVIEKLMRRFIFTAGITGAMQIGTLIIMTRLAS